MIEHKYADEKTKQKFTKVKVPRKSIQNRKQQQPNNTMSGGGEEIFAVFIIHKFVCLFDKNKNCF